MQLEARLTRVKQEWAMKLGHASARFDHDAGCRSDWLSRHERPTGYAGSERLG